MLFWTEYINKLLCINSIFAFVWVSQYYWKPWSEIVCPFPSSLVSAAKAHHNAWLILPSVIPEPQVYLSQLTAIHNNDLICHNFQHSSIRFHLEMQRVRFIMALRLPAKFPIWWSSLTTTTKFRISIHLQLWLLPLWDQSCTWLSSLLENATNSAICHFKWWWLLLDLELTVGSR